MKQEEHNLQVACIKWFDYQYPKYRKLLFAIPNGGQRSKTTAGKLKAEGVRSGVADLFLSIARMGKHGLYIELKTPKGTQQESQKEFAYDVNLQGYQYEIVRTKEEFIQLVKTYINA